MAHFLLFEGSSFLREKLVLSILSGKPIKIKKIRPSHENPGLKNYEICLLKLLEKLTNGTQIEINYTGTQLVFKPGVLSPQAIVTHDCEAERPIGYYLLSLISLSPFSKVPFNVELTGITNDNTDLNVDLIRTYTMPLLKTFGMEEKLELKVLKRGSSPLGGGKVSFYCSIIKEINPIQLLEFGKIKKIRGLAYSTRISPLIVNHVINGARSLLNSFIPDIYIYADHYKGSESGLSPGYGITLVAETTTGCLLSSEKCAVASISPEEVGEEAAKLLLDEIHRGGCVGTQNQNLALLYVTLSSADVSKIRIGKLAPSTIHFLRLLKKFFGIVFKIKADHETDTIVLTCLGIGYTNINRCAQ